MNCAPSLAPLVGPEGGVWRIRPTDQVPLTLRVESGASQITLDLQDVPITLCQLEAGASRIALTPPAQVENARVEVEAGLAALDVRIPEEVAARIVCDAGLATQSIDLNRFPFLGRGVYQSPDYESAPYRVELRLEVGAGSVTIR
ncbi:MAG: hypothetical protein D6793_06375 [Thermoflexia bacterium]|nr:MAG: hypothetical protein D6793_06375 [Thermoflexia bacterium]